ncbi:hypothetical protein CYMTET_47706 [Cymbomonas tetramitiformis]|uniref:Uncharacterized protein n=1 Tax=Cymbomonas tetramitiformis TaxID=36881 RepID=A0AAE0BVI1_9CHLO|nr:hypothetical protein CYMTET_47706 [Cymbomonas tetramitiformis]|eukprot:gene595-1001_t
MALPLTLDTNPTEEPHAQEESFVSQLECALPFVSASDIDFGTCALRTSLAVRFARSGHRKVCTKENASRDLRIYSKKGTAYKCATASLQHLSDQQPRSPAQEIENAICVADIYATTLFDQLNSKFTSDGRMRGVHFFPLTLTHKLQTRLQDWASFLSSPYTQNLMCEQHDFHETTAIHIFPVVPVIKDAAFPLPAAFLIARVWNDPRDSVRKATITTFNVPIRDCGESERGIAQRAIKRVASEMLRSYKRTDHHVFQQAPDKFNGEPLYTCKRPLDEWEEKDVYCEYLARCRFLFETEVLNVQNATVPRYTKPDVLRHLVDTVDCSTTSSTFGAVASHARPGLHGNIARSVSDNVAWSELVKSPEAIEVSRKRVFQERARLQSAASALVEVKDSAAKSKRRKVEERVLAYYTTAQDGFCRAQFVAIFSPTTVCNPSDRADREMCYSDRRLLERYRGTTTTVASPSPRYWFFCCTVPCEYPQKYNPLHCRLFGVLYAPPGVTSKEMQGGRTCAARIVCGSLGTAHQLRVAEPELDGPERRWDERGDRASCVRYPLLVDASVRADVYYRGARIACVWLPQAVSWKTLSVKAVYHPQANYDRICRAMAVDMDADPTYPPLSKMDAHIRSAPTAYVMASASEEDIARTFPRRVRNKLSKVMQLFERPQNNQHSSGGKKAVGTSLFPDMRHGTAAVVCALELLETIDIALCVHCTERVLGVQVSIVEKRAIRGTRDTLASLPFAIGSSPTLGFDVWAHRVQLHRREDGYYNSEEKFQHSDLFHAVRMSIPRREATLGYEQAADESARLRDYKNLVAASDSALDENWHVYTARRDDAQQFHASEICRNRDVIADSAWVYARFYLYPLRVLLDETLPSTIGFDADTIRRTKGACGELPMDANGASLRWRCVRASDGSGQVRVHVVSPTTSLQNVKLYVDNEDVQSPPSEHLGLDLAANEEMWAHFSQETDSSYELGSSPGGDVSTWSLRRVRVGTMLRLVTSTIKAQLILVPE